MVVGVVCFVSSGLLLIGLVWGFVGFEGGYCMMLGFKFL